MFFAAWNVSFAFTSRHFRGLVVSAFPKADESPCQKIIEYHTTTTLCKHPSQSDVVDRLTVISGGLEARPGEAQTQTLIDQNGKP